MHAGAGQALGDMPDLRHVGRIVALHPLARAPIEEPYQRRREGAPCDRGQPLRARRALVEQPRRAAFIDIDDRDLRQVRVGVAVLHGAD